MKKRKIASPHEERVTEKITNLLASANGSILQLVLLADADPDVMAKCADPELNATWESQWAKLSKNPSYNEARADQSLTYTPLIAQPNIGAFHRFAGMVLYNHGVRNNNRDYIVKAAQEDKPYHCFHALKYLTMEKLDEVSENEFAQAQAFHFANQAAKFHHCPGYLLLAEICFWFGQNDHHNITTRGQIAYQCCLQHLHTALRLETHSHASLHNAYFGDGIYFNGIEYDGVQSLLTAFNKLSHDSSLDLNSPMAKSSALVTSQGIIKEPRKLNF